MRVLSLALLACTLTLPSFAATKQRPVIAPLKTADGTDVGTVAFKQKGQKLQITLNLKGLPPGIHGVHVHQHPLCEAPDFKTAGPHFDPISHQHANVTVGVDGTAKYKYSVGYLSVGSGQSNDILANGGTSFMIHEKADDMVSDPTGNAGNRIACGVIPSPTAAVPAASTTSNPPSASPN